MAFDFMMDAPEPSPERYRFLQEDNLRLRRELEEANIAITAYKESEEALKGAINQLREHVLAALDDELDPDTNILKRIPRQSA